MKVIYKKIKVAMPHCGDCGEGLLGNNSIMSPYRCKCGTWEYDYSAEEFKLKATKVAKS